jgi:acetylornithine deacetylase/succinyl-diaminopimelate desuccinylase-like protein
VNPPGNETPAAELLRTYLEDNGVRCELYARVPERANLVARIGGGAGARLLLLSHTDTVLADAAEWQVDPWSGELRDEHVWGRGALDMKGQVAASAVAIASLARDGFEPSGDLIFAATADEEVGEGFGLQWLVGAHPDAVRAEYALNEGAGDRLELAGRVLYLCSTAEKMSSPFVLRVHGRSGHASMPGIADNALVRAAGLIERLAAYRPERRLEPETTALLAALTGEEPVNVEHALARAREVHPLAGDLVEPLLSLTLSPTMVQASHGRNVIPALCTVTVDCRLLPGQLPADVEPLLREVLGEGPYELEWLEANGGTRSTLESPLWDAVAAFVEDTEPGAAAAPVMTAGFTDSHWLREAFGTVAYGFFPMRTMDPELAARLVHSADERAHVDDLELGVRFLRHAAQTVLG